jgi:hypothetical protein
VIGISQPPTPSTITVSNRSDRLRKQFRIFPRSISTCSIWAATHGATGDCSQTGFNSSIETPSALAVSNRRASSRSSQQIGFIPAARIPRERNHCNSSMATRVLPTLVPVPVRNRLTPRLLRAPPEWSQPWKGKSWRHPRCRGGHHRRGQDAASSRKLFPRDYKCRQCFQSSRSDSIPE